MKMRVDKVVMVGVGLLGAYAVYRLLSNPKQIQPEVKLPPNIQPINLGSLPELPGPLPPSEGQQVLLGDVFDVENGRGYKGRLETGLGAGVGGGLSSGLSREQLAKRLEALGFDRVQIFMNPNEAQAAFLPNGAGKLHYALGNAGRDSRWFWARWPGPNSKVSRPQGMSTIFVATAPGLGTIDPKNQTAETSVAGNYLPGPLMGPQAVPWPAYGGSWIRI